jgi:hypothetical protein
LVIINFIYFLIVGSVVNVSRTEKHEVVQRTYMIKHSSGKISGCQGRKGIACVLSI